MGYDKDGGPGTIQGNVEGLGGTVENDHGLNDHRSSTEDFNVDIEEPPKGSLASSKEFIFSLWSCPEDTD